MKPLFQIALIVATTFLSGEASSVEISASTSEYVSMRDCSAPGVTGCDQISRVLFNRIGGLPGDSQSNAGFSVVGYGSGNGSVSLSGVIGAPILKASAISQTGKRVSTNSIALQRYVYSGETSSIRTFGGNISYAQQSTGTYSTGIGSGISAHLEIFTLPTSTISINASSIANFNMLFGGYANLVGYSSLGEATFQDVNSNANGSGNLSVTAQLNPGDAIWVWALVQTPATNGGWIDSSHTFVTAWSDTNNLTPAVVAVPELSSLALWLFGAAFLASVARTRRQGFTH